MALKGTKYIGGYDRIEDDEALREGDHVAVQMTTPTGLKIYHHGIVVKGKLTWKIISVTSVDKKGGNDCTIQKQDVGKFFGQAPKLRVRYKNERRSGPETAKKAEDLLGEPTEFSSYDATDNNCEHFATLCSTGMEMSEQTDTWRACFKTLLNSLRSNAWDKDIGWAPSHDRPPGVTVARPAAKCNNSKHQALPRFVGG